MATAGCNSEGPVLTLVFEGVPANTTRIAVTLHAMNVTFSGPDASNGNVDVSYVGGDVQIGIDADYAAARANKIRLPLTVGQDLGELDATAQATGAGQTSTVQAAATMIAARQSITLTFDFGRDGGTGGGAGGGGTGGAGGTGATGGAGGTGAGGAGGAAGGRGGTGGTGAVAGAGGAGVAGAGGAGTGGTGAAGGSGGGLAGAGGRGGTSGAGGAGGSGGATATGGAGGVAASGGTAGGGNGGSGGSGGGAGGGIPTHCALGGQYPASKSIGGSGPAVAYAVSAGVFGVAWRWTSGDVLYNAVTPAGVLQLSTDQVAVSAAAQSLSAPRLARAGADLIIAYGRRDATGAQPAAQAAVVRIAPLTGVATGAAAMGTNMAAATAAPEIGGVAASADGTKIGVISRAPSLSGQAAGVDAFLATPTFVTARAPAQFATARTSGIAWAPDRFMAGTVTDATSAGGTLLELSDTNLTVGPGYPFTGGSDAPTVGGTGATMSIAGAGDRVAVAWVDSQTGTREVRLALVSLASRAVMADLQASTTSSAAKSTPHVVFDGAAFALVWIEGNAGTNSQIKLARFDADLNPAGAPMNVGGIGAVNLGDLDIAAAGPAVYGIAAAGSGTTQELFYVTCN